MRLLITEFISGGGLLNHPLPSGLKQEGLMMLQALIRDCSRIDNCHIVTTFDPSISFEYPGIECVQVNEVESYMKQVLELARDVDFAWVVAPEHNNILVDLIDALEIKGTRTMNCETGSIRICGDKLDCAKALQAAGLSTIPTLSVSDMRTYIDKVVVKPRFGVGCEGLHVFNNGEEALVNINVDEEWIVQPFINGEHRSMSLLCWQGEAKILSCNGQEFIGFPQPRLSACKVNSCTVSDKLESLAQKIAAALPGLRGYVGVDFIVTENENIIVELNPRLTTSYIGLAEALVQNPAQLCIDVFQKNALPNKIENTGKLVEVAVV